MNDFEVHPIDTAARLDALQYDTPEAIATTEKAARELLELLKNGKLMKSLESNDLFKRVQIAKALGEQA